MCHRPADRFLVFQRGYLWEGHWADISIVDMNKEHQIRKDNTLYLCP